MILFTNEKNSPTGKLNTEDLKKIGTGLLVALAGAALTYITQVVAQSDFGSYTPLVVSFWAVVVNVARKLLEGK